MKSLPLVSPPRLGRVTALLLVCLLLGGRNVPIHKKILQYIKILQADSSLDRRNHSKIKHRCYNNRHHICNLCCTYNNLIIRPFLS